VLNNVELGIFLNSRETALKFLTPEQFHNDSIDLISEISLVTGARLYDGEYLPAQLKVIQRFLLNGFSMLTKAEIVYSFYLNLQGAFDQVYRHYNKELNCEFVGDVLRAYRIYKSNFIHQKGAKIDHLLIEQKAELITIDYDFWKSVIQDDYQAYCKGDRSLSFWSPRKYYTLRKFGLFPFSGLSTWFWLMKRAIANGGGGLNLPANVNMKNYKFTNARQVRTVFKTHEDFKSYLDYGRQVAYWYVLQACKDCGINNIFEDVAQL